VAWNFREFATREVRRIRLTLRQRLDEVAGPDPSACEYVGSQPAPVYEAAQHSRPC